MVAIRVYRSGSKPSVFQQLRYIPLANAEHTEVLLPNPGHECVVCEHPCGRAPQVPSPRGAAKCLHTHRNSEAAPHCMITPPIHRNPATDQSVTLRMSKAMNAKRPPVKRPFPGARSQAHASR